MSARVFHQPLFRERLRLAGIEPFYFLSTHYYMSFDFVPEHYFVLQVKAYDDYYALLAFLQQI